MDKSLEVLTFKQAAARYPAFSESSFRWMRFNGSSNGFDHCLIKLNRRVLLVPKLFERWLETHKVATAESEQLEAVHAAELERQLEQRKVAHARKPKRRVVSGVTPQAEV